jgi:hypothetical protein
VSIEIDSDRPIRKPADQRRLIEAVIAALSSDEADWIEWKSDLALKQASGRFSLARNILGMSNRHPDRAARVCGGLGYVIVGAGPGEVTGVEEIDPADLDNGLRSYLGSEGPEWSPAPVTMEEKTVLLITVEPPCWGQPPHPLRKTYQSDKQGGKGADDGTIFVRRNGATARANAEEVDMLASRTKRSPEPELQMTVDWIDHPSPLTPLAFGSKAHAEWIERERERLLAPLHAHQEKKRRAVPSNPLVNPTVSMFDNLQRSIASASYSAFAPQPEDRSPDEYGDEVEEYLTECTEQMLLHECIRALAERPITRVRLSLTNPTIRNLPDVEITLRLPGPVAAFTKDDLPDHQMPAPPRLFGTSRPSYLSTTVPNLSDLSPISRLPSRVSIDNSNSATVQLRAGNLRPQQTKPLPEFHLVAAQAAGRVVRGSWEATSTGVDAMVQGDLQILIADTGLGPLDLLKAS